MSARISLPLPSAKADYAPVCRPSAVISLALTLVQCYTIAIYVHIYRKASIRAVRVSDDSHRSPVPSLSDKPDDSHSGRRSQLLRPCVDLKHHRSAAF